MTSGIAKQGVTRPATPFDAHLAGPPRVGRRPPGPAPAPHRSLAFRTRPRGVLALDLAGHFAGMGFDPDPLVADVLDDLLTR